MRFMRRRLCRNVEINLALELYGKKMTKDLWGIVWDAIVQTNGVILLVTTNTIHDKMLQEFNWAGRKA